MKRLIILSALVLGTIPAFSQTPDTLAVAIDSTAMEIAIEADGAAAADTLAMADVDVDSLLGNWYTALQADGISAADSTIARYTTSGVPDSVLISRLEKMNSYITLPFNPTVKSYMILYSEKNPSKMAHMLGLSRYYMPIFEEAFDRYDMPLELKYMAIIESSLNATARSRVGARGMWQFMYSTAKLYGLKINSFVDERLDVEKAVDAAARYLRDAYNTFGDWNLAICSYNCGSGNVNKAIRRAGKKDFWSIYPYLPRETRGYVPAFVGAMYAMTYYKEYGIVPEQIDLPPYTDTLEIKKNLHFKQISEFCGIPLETLRVLNPQYVHDIIPGNEGTYILKMPYNYTNSFIDAQDSIYTHRASELMSPAILKSIREGGDGETIRYKVRSGDYLGKIAQRYHVSVDQIRRWNHLRNNTIRVGQILYVYRGGGPTPSSSGSTSSKSSGRTASGSVSTPPQETRDAQGYIVYTVRSGDSLYTIAKRYPGISANDIMSFNKISSNIHPGQKLRIPKK